MQNQNQNQPRAKSKEDQKEIEALKASADKAAKLQEAQAGEQSITKRLYKNENQKIDHDLFKLDVAPMMHDKGIQGKKREHIPVEHCHFFHSYDSSGRKQTYSTSIMGHCHKIDVVSNGNGDLFATAGDSVIKNGSKIFTLEDTKSIHRHSVSYQYSEKIDIRKPNSEARKAFAGGQ